MQVLVEVIERAKVQVVSKSGYSAMVTSIPHFCGGALVANWCLNEHFHSTFDTTSKKNRAAAFFNDLEEAARLLNSRMFDENNIPALTFYDKRGGIAWTLATAMGLAPLQVWRNDNSGNAVGLFMYHPQGD